MTIIRNIGKKIRMVADRIMQPGESKDITPSQAALLAGDKDFEIVEEAISGQQEVTLLKVHVMDEEPVQAKLEVTPSPQPSPKGRGGKARGKKEKKNGR